MINGGKYVYVDDLTKRYYENKNIFLSDNWDKKEENYYDNQTMDMDCEVSFTKNIVNEKGKIVRVLQVTKRKQDDSVVTTLFDITDFKKQETELLETKLNLNLAIESANITSWIYDVASDRVVTGMNSAYILLPNASFEDITMAISKKYREDFIVKFNRLRTGQTQTEVFMGMLNEDKIHMKQYVECKMSSLRDEHNHQVLKIAAALRDITYQHTYQKELEEQNRKRGLAIRASKFIHWDYDCITKRFYYDKESRVFNSFSRTADEFLENIHPEDLPTAVSFISDMNDSLDKNFDLNLRMRFKPNGEWRNSVINVIPLERDVNNKIIRYTGFRQDITDFIKLNEEMLELNRKTQLVLDNINSGMAYITTDYKVQWENMSKNLNFHTFEMGQYCYKNMCKSSQPCENCIMSKAIELGKPTSREIEGQDGAVYEMFAAPLYDKDNKASGVILRMDDVTERKRMFAELKQAKERAESSDKLKSTFLANMSHEIRTPLNAIVGFSDLLSDAEDDQEKQEYRNIIRRNNDLLLQLINDILDLSKMEAGYKDMVFQKFNVSGLFDEMVIMMSERFTNDKVKFIYDNPYSDCVVNLDPKRVSQLLLNFMTNAIKYTSEGYVKMSYEYIDNGLMLKVQDTGIGIAKHKQNKVFMRFEKLDSFAQGTGLGLSICKAIAEAMNGRIGFESEEGRGSTFWVWLPTEAQIK